MRFLRACLICLCVSVCNVDPATAASIFWDFEGTLTAQTGDPLGIEGEVIRLHLEFDARDVWVQGSDPTELYFPTVVAVASITGPHMISTNTNSPAARFLSCCGGIGGISEAVNSPGYVDFVLDGVLTTTFAPNGPAVLAPSAGDNLLMAHLRDDVDQFAALHLSGVPAYAFRDASLRIVPEPFASVLLAVGLAGLALRHR